LIIRGEKPTRADGKLLVIDGGFSKAFHPTTGIAGYTLIFNSQGLQLVQHEPFSSAKEMIEKEDDIHSVTVIKEFISHRMLVKETNDGMKMADKIADLQQLLSAFRTGMIKSQD
jgi:fructose-1,6-bisphosphatase-3